MTSSAAPRTNQQRREATRAAILKSAARLFGEKGYRGTTLAEIGEASGVTHGTVTYHFGSKLDCAEAVAADVSRRARERFESAYGELRGLPHLDALCRLYLDQWQEGARRGSGLLFALMGEAIGSSAELVGLAREVDSALRGHIVEAIGQAVEDGEIPAPEDLDGVAVVIAGLLRGIAIQLLVEPSLLDVARVYGHALSMVHAVLAAGPVPARPEAPSATTADASRPELVEH